MFLFGQVDVSLSFNISRCRSLARPFRRILPKYWICPIVIKSTHDTLLRATLTRSIFDEKMTAAGQIRKHTLQFRLTLQHSQRFFVPKESLLKWKPQVTGGVPFLSLRFAPNSAFRCRDTSLR